MAQEVLQDMGERLRAAAADVADAKTAYVLALEARDRLIVRAVDDGMSQRAVAAAAGVKVGRIHAVLAGSHADVDAVQETGQ